MGELYESKSKGPCTAVLVQGRVASGVLNPSEIVHLLFLGVLVGNTSSNINTGIGRLATRNDFDGRPCLPLD